MLFCPISVTWADSIHPSGHHSSKMIEDGRLNLFTLMRINFGDDVKTLFRFNSQTICIFPHFLYISSQPRQVSATVA